MSTPLTERLSAYIAWMAFDQSQSQGGTLMIEALAEIKRLEKEVDHLLHPSHEEPK